jgi:mRNA-degrading endonuclease YafQ of YafQ-DinJ toxin-antitoxin module
MFELEYALAYLKVYKKHVQKNQLLSKSLQKALETLRQNPFHNSLKTHKVDTRRNRDVWSSWVTGDWRVVWIFDLDAKKAIIICLEIGTHSGSTQIYDS